MKKIIRLNEQDIEKLVRKIIAESKTDAVVRYTEPELIMNITNLLVNELGYDPKRLPKDLDALDEILWEESQDYEDNIPDNVMADIQHLLSQIGLIKGHYNQTEDDESEDGDDYMEDDNLEWAKDSLKAKEGFDWLRHEPLDNLIGLRFEWDGNLYEITSAFDASEVDEDGNNFLGPYNEDEEGVWVYAIDPETGDEYDEAMPWDMIVSELEDGIASLID